MVDSTSAIPAELERLAPPDQAAAPCWNDVLRRADAQPAGPRARQPRRRIAIVLAVLLALGAVVAPAFALSPSVRAFLGFDRPRPVFDEARLMVSAPFGDGLVARVWISPATGGGQCWFLSLTRQTDGGPPRMSGGGSCGGPGTSEVGAAPIVWRLGMARRPLAVGDTGTWVPPTVEGWIDPKQDAVRVELQWNGGAEPLAFDNDFFVGVSERLYEPPKELLPFAIVAYDDAGREVARKKLDSKLLYLD